MLIKTNSNLAIPTPGTELEKFSGGLNISGRFGFPLVVFSYAFITVKGVLTRDTTP